MPVVGWLRPALRPSHCIVTTGIAILLVALAAGCGGGGAGEGPADPANPVVVTPELRQQVMDAVGAQVDALPAGATVAASVATVAASMAGRPEFEAIGSSPADGVAWGRFPDGVVYAVDVSPDTVAEPSDTVVLRTAAGERTGIARGPAVLFHTLPSPHVDVAATIRPWLLAAGYSVNTGAGRQATIANLKAVRGVDLFYLGTHGLRVEGGWAKPQWVALTAEEPTRQTQKLYAEDLADGSLVLVDRLFSTGRLRRYGFGAKFVRDHMRFGANSLVYIDACSSDPGVGFKGACLDAGASVYAGWDQEVHEYAVVRATPFMFDRMLCGNDPENANDGPPIRPFDYADAYAELKTRGWEQDEYGIAVLRFTEGLGQAAWLRPSIECLRVDENPTGAAAGQSELVVRGSFGIDPGSGAFSPARSVTCRGEQLSVISWSPHEIHTSLPVSGPGSCGDVVVTVGGIRSNAVPLTEWWVTATHRVDAAPGGDSTEFTQFTVNCHLRYDIHGWRERPSGAVRYVLPEPQEQPTTIARDSYGSFACGGDKMCYHPETQAFIYRIIYSGSGQLPYQPSMSGNGCWGTSRLHHEYVSPAEAGSRQGPEPVLFIRATVFAEGYPKKTELLWPDATVTYEDDRRVALNEYSNGTLVVSQGQEFDMLIGDGGVIEAGSNGPISWPRTVPRYQPTAATPRSR